MPKYLIDALEAQLLDTRFCYVTGYITHLLMPAVEANHADAVPAAEVELVKARLRDLG
jgi:hypothetical protein